MCIAQFLLAKIDRKPSVNEAAIILGAVFRIHFSVGKGTGFILTLVTPTLYARQ